MMTEINKCIKKKHVAIAPFGEKWIFNDLISKANFIDSSCAIFFFTTKQMFHRQDLIINAACQLLFAAENDGVAIYTPSYYNIFSGMHATRSLQFIPLSGIVALAGQFLAPPLSCQQEEGGGGLLNHQSNVVRLSPFRRDG